MVCYYYIFALLGKPESSARVCVHDRTVRIHILTSDIGTLCMHPPHVPSLSLCSQTIFTKMDADGDGAISKKEANAFWQTNFAKVDRYTFSI